ncbi:MAG: helix-turn-helix domain-containing protein [Lachnospiraceae bacterium]|nr:helix-turn-helix domain-containing protein [Lachnospiraceae bacterium]
MKKKGGYGVVYQEIMRNKLLSPEAKAIYAYLSSIAGSDDSCYPSVETMQKELCMGKNRLIKHMEQLIAFGVVEKVRARSGNIYGHNIYKITHEIEVANNLKRICEAVEIRAVEIRAVENEAVENEAVEIRAVENEATNNNNTTNNNITKNKKNNIKVAKSIKGYFPDDETLNQAFADYVQMRKQIKKPMTEKAVELAIKKLEELSKLPFSDSMDNDLAIQILNQSVMNSWQGLFPLREQKVNYQDKKGGAESGTGNQARGQAADYYKQFIRTSEGGSN